MIATARLAAFLPPIALAALAAPAAHAVEFGDTVSCAQVTPGGLFVCAPATAPVAPGPEFTIGFPGDPYIVADLSSGLLRLEGLRLGGPLITTVLEFRNLSRPFVAATPRPSRWDGYAFADDVTLASGALRLDLRGTSFNSESFIEIGLASYVPEPGTWAFLVAGFGLVGGALRRGRRAGHAVALA